MASIVNPRWQETPSSNPVRVVCYHIIANPFFDWFIIIAIVVNVLVMTVDYKDPSTGKDMPEVGLAWPK